tara:strand:+ start:301 stop:684 length:384 start_codon:yes stop_codon:yes gene_type:complete
MIVKIPVSLGELLDKISILLIKEQNIKDDKKLILVKEELKDLQKSKNQVLKGISSDKYLNELVEVNSKLWDIEDEIRDCERNKDFGENFIQLARSIYFNNDKRSKIKLEINSKYGSKIVEVKSYEEY